MEHQDLSCVEMTNCKQAMKDAWNLTLPSIIAPCFIEDAVILEALLKHIEFSSDTGDISKNCINLIYTVISRDDFNFENTAFASA